MKHQLNLILNVAFGRGFDEKPIRHMLRFAEASQGRVLESNPCRFEGLLAESVEGIHPEERDDLEKHAPKNPNKYWEIQQFQPDQVDHSSIMKDGGAEGIRTPDPHNAIIVKHCIIANEVAYV